MNLWGIFWWYRAHKPWHAHARTHKFVYRCIHKEGCLRQVHGCSHPVMSTSVPDLGARAVRVDCNTYTARKSHSAEKCVSFHIRCTACRWVTQICGLLCHCITLAVKYFHVFSLSPCFNCLWYTVLYMLWGVRLLKTINKFPLRMLSAIVGEILLEPMKSYNSDGRAGGGLLSCCLAALGSMCQCEEVSLLFSCHASVLFVWSRLSCHISGPFSHHFLGGSCPSLLPSILDASECQYLLRSWSAQACQLKVAQEMVCCAGQFMTQLMMGNGVVAVGDTVLNTCARVSLCSHVMFHSYSATIHSWYRASCPIWVRSWPTWRWWTAHIRTRQRWVMCMILMTLQCTPQGSSEHATMPSEWHVHLQTKELALEISMKQWQKCK